ncbi:MAG: hypothetical protein Q9201_007914 [Fulgogasparrea decipioides]
MASPALSQASTAFESDVPQAHDEQKAEKREALQCVKEAAPAQDILTFLIAFRILNTLSIRTFFQPDEYFQSLEPAWEIAFGADSGAWITWEWKNQLRSAIHPAIFASVYRLSAQLSNLLQLTPNYHAELLLAAPRITQAVIAALGDHYTWKLGERIYGRGSNEAWAALFLTVTSPWQWFCSTRTLSNCLETTLTVIALHQWPWHWSLDANGVQKADKYGLREAQRPDQAEELANSGMRSPPYKHTYLDVSRLLQLVEVVSKWSDAQASLDTRLLLDTHYLDSSRPGDKTRADILGVRGRHMRVSTAIQAPKATEV